MEQLPEAMELLSARLDALERRVQALEHPAEAAEPLPLQVAETPVVQARSEADGESMGGAFVVFGRAMLGIAGAYVLRALVESSALPRLAIAVVAIVYAVAWLVVAARVAAAKRFAGAVYAGTSALILAPMLWELTLRFNMLTPVLTALVLGAFIAIATILGWAHERAIVAMVAYGASSIAAVGLAVATHQMVPFLLLLLLMVVVCEYLGMSDHALATRPLVVLAADFATWAMLSIYGSSDTNHADYPVLSNAILLAPALLLLLVIATRVGIRTGVRREQISVFDAIQAVVAFLLVVFSMFLFESAYAPAIMGTACVILSVVCYAAVLGRFSRTVEQRNFRVFSIWGLALLLAGSFWILPPEWAAGLLGVAALASIATGVRMGCRMLELHGVIYLVVASVASRLLEYATAVLAGTLPSRPAGPVLLVALCAVLAYVAGRERQGEVWQEQVLHLVPALIASISVAAFIAHSLLGVVEMRIVPGAFHVAFVRTLAICAVALAFAYGGGHWHRLEMTRVAYAALALMALKLMFEDLRHSHMEFIAGSIFLFAVTLIAVPRLTRMQHKT